MAIDAASPLDATFEVQLPLGPYPGLRPFEKHEWPVFFGREQMIDEVIHRLISQHLVVVHGDSGCGKSSLIRAGVLAQLEQEHARSGVRWRTCAMLPREAPLRNLANELAKLDAVEADRDRARQIRRSLNLGHDAPTALAELLGSDDGPVCILIDQFEELFSFARKHGRAAAQLFVDILIGLQRNPPPGLYVILTMRSEFLGVCAQFKGFPEAVNKTQYLLPQMERAALLRAIREPATLYNGEVSRPLAERLVDDAGGGQDQLPLIQHGLMRLSWAKVQAAKASDKAWRLDLDDYSGTGGLAALLSEHADQLMAEAAPDAKRQKIVEHMFRALTDINAEGSAIRRPQTFGELLEVTGGDEQSLRKILDHFRAEGVSFLRPYGDVRIESDTLVDISHEALIRCWHKIANEEDGWLKREFQDGLIWQSLRLQADKFAKNNEQILSAAETTYSERWLTTVHLPAWADRYKDCWAGVERLMQASRAARARQTRKDAWIRRGLIFATLFFLALSGVATWNWWRATAAEAETLTERDKALFGDSLYRATQARSEREKGNAVNAMLLALAGLPQSLKDTEARSWIGKTGSALVSAFATQREHLLSLAGLSESPKDAEARSWVGETAGALVEAIGEQRERLVLRGHKKDVLAAAFSPDGARIVSGSADGTVRVWAAADGAALMVLPGHDGLIKAVAYSPQGDRIVSGSEDRTVRVWDAASEQKLALVLRGHEGWVNAVGFSPDGKRIVSGSADGTVRVWDAASGVQLLSLENHEGDVYAVAFSPDGMQIVSGAKDQTVRVWDAGSGTELLVLRGHGGAVNAVSFSADGRWIVSGSADHTVRVWDATSGTERSVLGRHEGDVLAAAFSPDGTQIVSGSEDRTVRVWEIATGLQVDLRAHEKWVTAVDFSPDGTQVLSGSADNTVRVWDVDLKDLLIFRGQEQDDVRAAVFSRDGTRIVGGSGSALGGPDNTVRVWDAESGREIWALRGHDGPVLAAAFSPDGRRIVSGSGDRTARVWDPEQAWESGSGEELLLEGHDGWVNAVAYSPDGLRIVSGSADRTLRVWDAASGAELLVLDGHGGDVYDAAFSPDGARIVSGSRDGTVRVWDAASGEEISVLRGHRGAVNAVAFSADDRRIASGSADDTVRVWDAASGEELLILEGHDADVLSVAFSPDGRWIVSGGGDNTVRVWDAASGEEILVLRGHEGAVWAAAFSPNGQRIVSGSDDNTLRLIKVPSSKHELIDTARARLPRELTDEERRRFYLAPD